MKIVFTFEFCFFAARRKSQFSIQLLKFAEALRKSRSSFCRFFAAFCRNNLARQKNDSQKRFLIVLRALFAIARISARWMLRRAH